MVGIFQMVIKEGYFLSSARPILEIFVSFISWLQVDLQKVISYEKPTGKSEKILIH